LTISCRFDLYRDRGGTVTKMKKRKQFGRIPQVSGLEARMFL
jgi:hypothetical protein